MKLKPMKMATFFMVTVLCVAVALLAQRFPEFHVLEYAKWGLVAWLALDVVVSVLPAGWLVRAHTPARGWASRLFDELPPERDDRIWSPEQLAAIKASMEAGEPHRFNLIGDPDPFPDYIGEFKPRTLEELTPLPYQRPVLRTLSPDEVPAAAREALRPAPVDDHAERPWPPVCVKPPELDPNLHGPGSPDMADVLLAGMLPPMDIRKEFAARRAEHDRRMAEGRMTYDERKRIDQLRALEVEDYVTKVLAYDDAVDAWLAGDRTRPQPIRPERPSWLRSTRVLPATTLPTGSESTQEARSGAVSGDSQLLDKDRDAWGNEVHGAVKGLVESDGVALTPHEEADLRKRVHAFMAGGEELHAYSDTVTIDQTRPGRIPGRAEAIRNSTFGKDMEAHVFGALSGAGDTEQLTRGITLTPAEVAARRKSFDHEVHDAVRGLIEVDGVPLTPFEEADLRRKVQAFMVPGEPSTLVVPVERLSAADVVKIRADLREASYREFGAAVDATQVKAAIEVLAIGPERMEVHVGPLQWGGDDELERLMAEEARLTDDELERLLDEADGQTGMVVSGPPAGPVRVADGLHPTDLRQRREQRQRAYWEDRITQLDPDLMDENNHSGPAEVVRALFRAPDGLDEEGVRRTVTTLAHEVAAFTPPMLAGPVAMGLANEGTLTVLTDTRLFAHHKVEAIGKVAIALAQANARLRTQAIAHFGQRLNMDTRGTEHSTVEVDDHPAERFAAMSRGEAFAICERMGWIRPALGVGYKWVED